MLSADTPGRQIDRHNGHAEAIQVGHHGLEKSRERAAETGAEDRIDDQLAIRELAEVQLPLLRVGNLDDGDADAAEDLEVGPCVAAHFGHAAEEKHDVVDAALRERARDHESVATVVAAAADDPDAARRQVVEGSFHGRHRLAAGILHEHDRRNPDVLDGAAIRLAHLFGIEHSHGPGRAYCLC